MPAAPLGPGATYLLELPSRKIRFIEQRPGAFPKAFYSLVETTDIWDQIVDDSDLADYQAATTRENLQPEAAYHVKANRRGETLPVKDYRNPIKNAEGQTVGLVGLLVDDSFRNMAMDSLMRRSWKEIATAMTRRFLHDFNNTIAGIYSLSELYSEPGSDAKSMTEAMGHIRDCAVRAQEITRQIRHVTTLEKGEASYFDLCKLLREQDDFLCALLPKGATIHYQLPEEPLPVHLDANQFRQAILLLAANACDAAGANVKLHLRLSSETKGRYIIEFQDNGPGFRDGEIVKATEAFYTSKDPDRHPGLGLTIVKVFMESLGGEIQVANGEDGAIVKLSFPQLPDNSESAEPSEEDGSKSKIKLEQPDAARLRRILIYTWEDIARHPLLLAMREQGWDLRLHLEPGQLLVDLAQPGPPPDGIVVFKSALDEKAEPLLSELGNTPNRPPIALVALGEGVETVPEHVKRICGFIASGTSKSASLLSKLAKYFN